MSRSRVLMFGLVVFLWMVCEGSSHRGAFVGGKMEVRDVKSNKEVQELGRFCVDEFNRQWQLSGNGGGGGQLEFSEVVEAQQQVVSGIKYFLVVEVVQDGVIKVFDSEVVVQPWLRSKQLLKFAPSIRRSSASTLFVD